MNRDELPQMLAAGGLVLCGGYGLLIRKHGKWDIPKGKLKEYEPLDRCAVREISEETGLKPRLLSIRASLCRSSYVSYYSGIPMNKTVSWFLLDYAGQLTDALTPDLTEDIDLCQWVPVTDLVETLEAARRYLGPVRQRIRQYLSVPVVLSGASVA
jgi:8-oxo-dGTP pyrophosphatase MutT (NUDIX family)